MINESELFVNKVSSVHVNGYRVTEIELLYMHDISLYYYNSFNDIYCF